MLLFRFPLFAALPLAAVLAVNAASGAAVVAGFNTDFLGQNDDGSAGPVPLGLSANFFGTTYTQAYLNNNGNITFDETLGAFTPFSLIGNTGNPIIAPFFADVDTRGAGSDLLRYGNGTFAGRTTFGVTWDGVGYYEERTDKLNSFQLLLVDRSDTGAAGNFDIYFNYDQIQWETGEASDGTDGLGGSSARVGYSNGSGTSGTFVELAGSGINGAFLDGGPNSLVAGSNIGVAGRFLFEVRGGVVSEPEPPVGVPDSGSAIALLGLALAGVALARRRVG